MVMNRGTWDSHDASYMWTRHLHDLTDESRKGVIRLLNYMVYGFLVIFDDFQNSIIPVTHYNEEDTPAIGTSFLVSGHPDLILTSAHCLTDAKAICLRGISKDQFRDAEIFVSKNPALDIAMIVFSNPILPNAKRLELGWGRILDEVIAVGYPNTPTFTEVLAVEKASISSEITPTKGIIASKPTEMFTRLPLYLISARVRGGFSGGPIINDRGLVVGMVLRQPTSKDATPKSLYAEYDNLGYGIAIPAEYIEKFIKGVCDRDQSVYETIKIKEYREE
jgi:serine protease Do